MLSYFHAMSRPTPNTFLFDLAGVLIRWNATPLYLQLFDGNQAAVNHFFSEVFTAGYQNEISKGRPTLDVIAELTELHPAHRIPLQAWWQRWPELIGSFDDTVAIARRLHAGGHRIFILGNWGREEFDRARQMYDFLDEFDGAVISGDVGAMKPESAIYRTAIERLGLLPEHTLFIDDRGENVDAAKQHGFLGHVFEHPEGLERCLSGLSVQY